MADRFPPQLFFIVGRGRSGTTLLSRILNEHPAIAVAPEGLFIRNLSGRYGQKEQLSKGEARAFFRDAFVERRMDYWGMDGAEYEAAFVQRAEGVDFRTAAALLYQLYGEMRLGKDGLKWIGDKNPHYSLYAERLRALYPEAKFLHLVRDPRDNVRSFRNVDFDIDNNAGLAYRWRVFEERIRKAMLGIPEEQYSKLRYEELLSEPEESLKRICAFFGLDFEPAMLDFHERQTGEDREWHQKLRTPLDPEQIGKWRSELDDEQVREIEIICSPEMEENGYSKESSGEKLRMRSRLGLFFGKLVTFFEDKIFGLPFWVRIRAINLYRRIAGAR